MKNIEKSKNIAYRIIEGQAFIVDTQKSILHELDEIGTFIWKFADSSLSLDDLARKITQDYDVSYIQAKTDVNEFLNDLASKGLVTKISNK